MKYGKSKEYKEKEQEAAEIRKDISTARSIIYDGISRYKKKMLRARSKKQADDLSVFDELNDFNSREDIRDSYGWGFITETKMDRLMQMWDAREKLINDKGKFENRVTEMLERASLICAEPYIEILDEFEIMERKREEEIKSIEKRNAEIDYQRYIAGLKQERNFSK